MSLPSSVIVPVSAMNSPAMALEQRGLARAVGADNRRKVAVVQMQVHVFEGDLFIDSAQIERFADVFQIKHGGHLPSGRWRGGGGNPPWP